jgi:hypothetical protein
VQKQREINARSQAALADAAPASGFPAYDAPAAAAAAPVYGTSPGSAPARGSPAYDTPPASGPARGSPGRGPAPRRNEDHLGFFSPGPAGHMPQLTAAFAPGLADRMPQDTSRYAGPTYPGVRDELELLDELPVPALGSAPGNLAVRRPPLPVRRSYPKYPHPILRSASPEIPGAFVLAPFLYPPLITKDERILY